MVELDLRRLDHRPEQSRAAVGRGLLQVRKPFFNNLTEKLCRPLGLIEVLNSIIDVVGQEPAGIAEVLDIGDVALDAGQLRGHQLPAG